MTQLPAAVGRSRVLVLAAVLLALFAGLLATWAAEQTPPAGQPPAPQAPAPPPAKYVGSEVCLPCHKEAAKSWADSAHGKGLTAADLPEANRGCEACHGPGSDHVGSMGKTKIGVVFSDKDAPVEAACGKCHIREGDAGVPDTGRRIDPKYWRRSLHARQQASCLTCHKIHGGEGRALKQPPEALCLSCHGSVVNKDGPYTHQPVAQGKCLLCHVPHGGAPRHNLADDVAGTCRSCHRPEGEKFAAAHSGYGVAQSNCLSCHSAHSFDREHGLLAKNQHPLFAERKCEACHTPSVGDAVPELRKPAKELCLTCHSASKIRPTKGPDGKPLVQHPPVQQGLCTTCHSPHASAYPAELKDRTDYVCFFCHAKVETATRQPYSHKPVATGNCLLCHRGHVSPEAKLLTKESISLCVSCHTTQGKLTHPVGLWKGKMVRDPATGAPVVCARCHAVHGSAFPAILPSEEDALCRGCHKT